MNIKILASGSSGNSVCLDNIVLIDAGISTRAFQAHNLDDSLEAVLITHRHQDHLRLPLLRYLINNGVRALLPTDVIADVIKEGQLDILPLIEAGQVVKIAPDIPFVVGDLTIYAHAQSHHDIVNYAFTVEKAGERLLYATDLDSLTPTDKGVGLMCLGMFDTIMLEGNYDEIYLRKYIEHMIALLPDKSNPDILTDDELDKWVRANYKSLPKDVAGNAFRAIQNRRHLSKQQARAYAATHLKPGGEYYEIHRSRQFYEEPINWAEEI